MKRQRKPKTETAGARIFCCIRAAFLGCALTAVFVILLALLLKWDVVDVSAVRICNTAFKTVSACCCGVLCALRLEKGGGAYGGAAGLLYIVLSYAIFSLIERSFTFDASLLSDAGLGLICGFASAILFRLIRSLRAQSA